MPKNIVNPSWGRFLEVLSRIEGVVPKYQHTQNTYEHPTNKQHRNKTCHYTT